MGNINEHFDIIVYSSSRENPVNTKDYHIILQDRKLLIAIDTTNCDYVIFSGKHEENNYFRAKRSFRAKTPVEAYTAYSEYKQIQENKAFCEQFAELGINPYEPI